MAEYIWEIPGETPKEWNRNTVADGKWLNKNTILPLMNRDNKLLSLIEEQGSTERDERIYNDGLLWSAISAVSGNNTFVTSTDNSINVTTVSAEDRRTYDLSLNLEETKYGILDNTTFVSRNNNNWSFNSVEGTLSANGNIITGLTHGKLYHVTCDLEYNVETQLDGYTRATITDHTPIPHDFLIDMSFGADVIIPAVLSYDFVATDDNYEILKWNTEDDIIASLCIKHIYIHEVAAEIVNSQGHAAKDINVKTYGIYDSMYLIGNNNYRKIYLNGTIETSDGTMLPIKTSNTLELKQTAKYNCVASISFYNTSVLDAYEICKIRIPFNDKHKEVMTYTFDCGIEYTEENPLTIPVVWQCESCTSAMIEFNTSNYWKAKLNYIHITEIN